MSGQDGREPVPLSVAAATMGISSEALRKRLKRGTIDGFRDNRNRWMVYTGDAVSGASPDAVPQTVRTVDLDAEPLVVQLKSQIEDLRREVSAGQEREARLLAIIEQMTVEERADPGVIEKVRRWLFGNDLERS